MNSHERQNIIDAAHLTLGYVYFELSNYETAKNHLLAVSPDFYDYPDVLLAIGWSFLKLKDYSSALGSLNRLVKDYPDYYNIEEAYFLIGQCYLKLGYYDFAITEYDKIIRDPLQSAESENTIDEAKNGLIVLEKRIEQLRTELLALESKFIESIPLPTATGTAIHDIKELEEIPKVRENLIRQIINDRAEFDKITIDIFRSKKRIEKNERRKKWQAYAEYGKVRALFLKGVVSQ